jgi:hypothetical protein
MPPRDDAMGALHAEDHAMGCAHDGMVRGLVLQRHARQRGMPGGSRVDVVHDAHHGFELQQHRVWARSGGPARRRRRGLPIGRSNLHREVAVAVPQDQPRRGFAPTAIEGSPVVAVEEGVGARRVTRGQETQRAQPVVLVRADQVVAEVEHRRLTGSLQPLLATLALGMNVVGPARARPDRSTSQAAAPSPGKTSRRVRRRPPGAAWATRDEPAADRDRAPARQMVAQEGWEDLEHEFAAQRRHQHRALAGGTTGPLEWRAPSTVSAPIPRAGSSCKVSKSAKLGSAGNSGNPAMDQRAWQLAVVTPS